MDESIGYSFNIALVPRLRLNAIELRKRHFWKALKGRIGIARGKALGILNKI